MSVGQDQQDVQLQINFNKFMDIKKGREKTNQKVITNIFTYDCMSK